MQKCYFFISVAGVFATIISLIFSSYAICGLNDFIVIALKVLLFAISTLGLAIHSIGFKAAR